MTVRRLYSLLMMFGTLAALTACGAGEVGDECDKEADSNECEDGAFCAKTKSGELECMKICTDKIDCPTMTECVGSKETIKVCQPK
jgi:hypothetical protein